LGRRITIHESKEGKGYVRLAYSSPEDLENLVIALCGRDFFEKEN
jgi:hypothetical protein